MTTWRCLLVSASCIISPPIKQFGPLKSEFIQGALNSKLRFKNEGFATDIYVLLDSPEYQKNGSSWLQSVGFFSEKFGDLDIIGRDRLISLHEVGLASFVSEYHVTHVISRDVKTLRLINHVETKRYLYGFDRAEGINCFCFSAWKELASAVLAP